MKRRKNTKEKREKGNEKEERRKKKEEKRKREKRKTGKRKKRGKRKREKKKTGNEKAEKRERKKRKRKTDKERNEKNISSPQPRIGRWVFRIQKRHEHCSCLPHKKLPVTRILFFLSIRQSALRGRRRQILPPACLSAAQSSARSPAKSIRFRHGFARP